jgi:ATPase complex subunit ATP10
MAIRLSTAHRKAGAGSENLYSSTLSILGSLSRDFKLARLLMKEVNMLVSRKALRSTDINYNSLTCLLCQWRSFSSSYRSLVEKETQPPPPPPPQPQPPTALDDAPRAYGKAVTEFTPKSLNRPIGLSKPPKAGENAGIDSRSWKQRRDDFVNYDKHIARRKEL